LKAQNDSINGVPWTAIGGIIYITNPLRLGSLLVWVTVTPLLA